MLVELKGKHGIMKQPEMRSSRKLLHPQEPREQWFPQKPGDGTTRQNLEPKQVVSGDSWYDRDCVMKAGLTAETQSLPETSTKAERAFSLPPSLPPISVQCFRGTNLDGNYWQGTLTTLQGQHPAKQSRSEVSAMDLEGNQPRNGIENHGIKKS